MKKISIILCWLLTAVIGAQAEVLSVDPVAVWAGETGILTLSLDNESEEYTAYQFVLTLPEGIALATDNEGQFLYSLSGRHDESYTLTISPQTAGKYMVVCYSPQSIPLTGTSGTLLTLTIQADTSVKGQQLLGQVGEILFSDAEGEKTQVEVSVFHINVLQPVLSVDSIAVGVGETEWLTFSFDNVNEGYTAYQFVLMLPDGITLATDNEEHFMYSLSSRHDESYILTVSPQTAGKYIIVCYSPQSVPLTGTSGTLLTLAVRADVSVKGDHLQGQVSEILFSDSEGEKTQVEASVFPIRVGLYPTITINNATREYGEENPQFTFTVTGDSLHGEPMLTTDAIATSPVGEYAITAERGTIENAYYEVVDGTLTVTKAPLTITVGNYTIKRGNEMPTFEVTYDGWKNGENEEVLTQKPTVACEADSASVPGSYIIKVEGAEAQNYEITFVNGTLTVEKADSVTFIAKDYTVEYGNPLPTFEYDFITDSVGQSGEPQITCEAVQGSPVGTYPIVITKGNVTNYNDHYVNGTLTITKALLTVSLEGEYSRYVGEENPDFAITYSGWKMDDDESVLTVKPAVMCEADTLSPVGEYPVIVSGGAAANYELSYIGGTLTVKEIEILDSVAVTVLIDGFGSLRLSDGRELDEEEQTVNVPQGKNLVLTCVPDDGYRLGRLRIGETDVDADPQTGVYVIPAIRTDTLISVIFMEDVEFFVEGGIKYGVYPETMNVKVLPYRYEDEVRIPETVEHGGTTWKVIGLAANAFANNSWLYYVSVPKTVTEAGGDLFKRCTRMAALTWNPEQTPLTQQMVNNRVRNRNMLWFVKERNLMTATPIGNVVVNGKADRVELADDGSEHGFYNPVDFTAGSIQYTHNYKLETTRGHSMGWETISLPFDVDEFYSVTQSSRIYPFGLPETAAEEVEKGTRPFWLYNYDESADGFKVATAIQANTPYIISVPNNTLYESIYMLAGNVVFRTQRDVTVKASDNLNVSTGTKRAFYPCFQTPYMPDAMGINLQGEGYSDKGSIFMLSGRLYDDIQPFAAYFRYIDGSTKEWFSIFEEMADGIGEIKIEKRKEKDEADAVYDLAGRRVKDVRRNGIYIVNGRKVVVK